MKIIVLICYCLSPVVNSSVRQRYKEETTWHMFLDDVYTTLSAYSIQKKLHKNITTNLHYQRILQIKPRNLPKHIVNLGDSDVEMTLRRFKDTYPNINHHITSTKHISQLDDVLNLTIKQKPNITCHANNSMLVVTGNFVKLSDLSSPLRCADNSNLELIEIFATDTVFIDQDLFLKGSNVTLAIMAPLWSVQGVRKFELDGITPLEMAKALPGKNPGDEGIDGMNGEPGWPGGNFLGIGKNFVNGDKLTITTSGSKGGSGQDGGDGATGIKGTVIECFDFEMQKCHANPGARGGAGGNGGMAGAGGLPGRITIFHLKQDSSVKVRFVSGASGIPGKGGSGGIGGMEGDIRLKTSHSSRLIVGQIRGPTGPNGRANFSDKEIEPAKLPTYLINRIFNSVMKDYKIYLIENMKSRHIRNEVFNVLVSIYTNENITRTLAVSIVDISDDFLRFEKHFSYLHGKVDLLLFYQGFQNYVEKLSKNVTGNNEEIIKVLCFLYTAALSKISFLENLADAKFIANLDNFLDMFLENIKKLKEIDREVITSDLRNNNKKRIDDQIFEAKDMLDRKITPMIEKYMIENEENVLNIYQNMKTIIFGELSSIRDHLLPPILQMNFLISNIKTAVKVLSVFMDTCKTFGDAIDSSHNFVGSFSGETTNRLSDTFVDADNLIKTVKHVTSEKSRKKIEIFRHFLEQKINTISPFSEVIDSLTSLKKEMNSWNFYDDITEKFLYKLSMLQEELESYFSIHSLILEGEQLATVMKSGITFDETLLSDESFIGNCLFVLELDREKMGLLQSYEKRIENSMQPILKTITESSEEDDLEKSLNKLNTIQEQVQIFLQETMAVFKNFIRDFETTAELTEQIQSIISVVHIMNQNFQRVQDFQAQKKMADYITGLSSIRFKNIVVKNRALAEVLSKIEMSLQSNFILLQYTQFVDQLKMFVFPLAKTFFKNFNVPLFLEPRNTSEEYLKDTIAQVETFKLKIYETKIYSTEYDRLKHRGKFYPNTINGPFYVWYGKEYRHSMQSLLAGEEVIFQADVTKHRENAVKFNRIDLNVKSHDKNTQPQLDSILNHFLLSMTHMGTNYYKCNKQSYMIKTESQEFQFSFKKHNKHPVESNLVYDKLQNGDFMLSPFTTWKIRIINITAPNYKRLKTFARQVDLELVGDAEYFVGNKKVCESDLREYYEISNMLQKT